MNLLGHQDFQRSIRIFNKKMNFYSDNYKIKIFRKGNAKYELKIEEMIVDRGNKLPAGVKTSSR